MHYIVSLSGGVASAVAADRAIQRYGRKHVTLWFADTSWEDEDLYRFMDDCQRRWRGKIITFRDGRTPLDVAEDHHIIPNNSIAPCSFELKVKPFTEFLWKHPKSVTVLLGLDWKEMHRIDQRNHYHQHAGHWRKPTGYHTRIPGVYEDYPLLWKPIEYRPYIEVVKSWGIEPPRLYRHGFPHNNCGGRCVRQGIDLWMLLKREFPERYAGVKEWETVQRSHDDARSNYAILRDRSNGKTSPLTLAELETRGSNKHPIQPAQDDLFACMCSY